MQVMKETWDGMGYEDFGLTSQNLRDQAAHLEKSMGDATGSIIRRIGKRKQNGLIDSNNGESGQREMLKNRSKSLICIVHRIRLQFQWDQLILLPRRNTIYWKRSYDYSHW